MPLPLVWLLMFSIDAARYLLVVVPVFLVFWVWGAERWRRRRVDPTRADVRRMLHDAKWSVSTVLVFSVFGVGIWYGKLWGVLRGYPLVSDHGWPYFFVSIAILVLLQDAYFYFSHRAMHHPWLYERVHRTHHVTVHTSPWTAYAFSPWEAAIHALFVPLVMLVMPLHDMAVFVFLAFMIVRNVLGHMAIELYASGFSRSRVWGWATTTTHHALHHKYFRSNYGLYFTFWDRVMGTTHPRYDEEFERVAVSSTGGLVRPR